MSTHSEGNVSSRSVRKRTLSHKGGDFFLKTGIKNQDKSHRNVRNLVTDVDSLLNEDNLEEAKVKVVTLVEAHKEFLRRHLRYQELLRQQPNVPGGTYNNARRRGA